MVPSLCKATGITQLTAHPPLIDVMEFVPLVESNSVTYSRFPAVAETIVRAGQAGAQFEEPPIFGRFRWARENIFVGGVKLAAADLKANPTTFIGALGVLLKVGAPVPLGQLTQTPSPS